jgi:hypothetical protein
MGRWLGLCCERNFQQYFIYVVAVCFIGRGNTYLLVSDFNMENIKIYQSSRYFI